jgi:hypothetical protein
MAHTFPHSTYVQFEAPAEEKKLAKVLQAMHSEAPSSAEKVSGLQREQHRSLPEPRLEKDPFLHRPSPFGFLQPLKQKEPAGQGVHEEVVPLPEME